MEKPVVKKKYDWTKEIQSNSNIGTYREEFTERNLPRLVGSIFFSASSETRMLASFEKKPALSGMRVLGPVSGEKGRRS